MRILMVEDDDGIARGLALALLQFGWTTDSCADLASAWASLSAERFDLVLLDLQLPDGDGGTLLRRLRQAPAGHLPEPRTPVLIMTARDEVSARIQGLDLGADDYVVKPFDTQELAARMRAAHRRAAGRADPHIRWGDLELDPASRQVRRAGQPVMLSTREFSLLQALLEASPRVLTRQQIEASLYSWGTALESNAIEVHVHHLRRKLGEGVVRTLRGVGYFVPRQPGA